MKTKKKQKKDAPVQGRPRESADGGQRKSRTLRMTDYEWAELDRKAALEKPPMDRAGYVRLKCLLT